RGAGAERILLLGLRLANELLDAPLHPDLAGRVMADSSLAPLLAQIRADLFNDPGPALSILRSALFHLRARERWSDRLLYVVRLAASPNVDDWSLVPLPAALSFLYLPLRAVRLAAKYGLRRGRR